MACRSERAACLPYWHAPPHIPPTLHVHQGEDLSGLPDPLPFPWSLSAEDTRAPGFYAA